MIFVTGGTGMLGSYLLLELLEQGQEVRASRRKESSFETTKKIFHALSSSGEQLFSKIEWVNIDLSNSAEVEQYLDDVSVVYHCAAQINGSSESKYQLVKNNQEITESIVNASLRKGVDKFCYVSSIAALGNTYGNRSISETTSWKAHKNNSMYSVSKYYSELEVWRAMAEGLNAVIINPSVILGIGNWQKGSANLFEKIYNGLKYYTLGSSGFVDARDVAKIMLLLVDCKTCFGQSYIVSAENLNYQQLFEKIAQALSVKPPYIYATKVLTFLAWNIEWIKSHFLGFEPLITKESAQTAHKILSYNNTKLLDVLPFKYRDIDTSIKEIASVFLSENSNKS